MNPATFSGGNVVVYQASRLVSQSYSVSRDGTTLTFSPGALSFGTTYTLVVNPNVSDLAGNPLGNEYTSRFTTTPSPAVSGPSVTAFRPGAGASGVSPNALLTFYVSAALNPATVTGALEISQNGVLITGTANLTDNNQVVTFTPSVPFQLGALVQVWFTSAATDTSGNPLANYQTSFRVAADRHHGSVADERVPDLLLDGESDEHLFRSAVQQSH